MERGTYPGYRAAQCNGCGLCCKTSPCSVSNQFGLWRNGRCIALMQVGDRHACGVITAPLEVDRQLAAVPLAERLSAIGAGHGCDHRAAWSIDEAKQLLATRNLADDLFKNPGDTYPRACVLHTPDGRHFCVYQARKDAEPTVFPMSTTAGVDGRREVPLSMWIDRGGVK